MRFEIERKFLVAHAGWREAATGRRHLRDGLVGHFAAAKVRVRLEDEAAWLTVKGARQGLGRPEFEYAIPREDAEAMLRTVCVGCVIEKVRHCVPHGGLTWEVDEYRGPLAGIVLAEVELDREDQPYDRPDWLGREVSGDPRFRQSTLLQLCDEAGRSLTAAEVLAGYPTANEAGLFI